MVIELDIESWLFDELRLNRKEGASITLNQWCLCIAIFAWGGTALATSFDPTSKIGSAASSINGNQVTCGILAAPADNFLCKCSIDSGATWVNGAAKQLPIGSHFYSNSGIYLVPELGSSATTAFLFFVINNSGGDFIDEYSVLVSGCGAPQKTNEMATSTRIGPRLGVMFDHSLNDEAWAFFVVPRSSNQLIGETMGVRVESGGGGIGMTPFDTGVISDPNFPPIASGLALEGGNSTLAAVVTRKDGQHVQIFHDDGGPSWDSLIVSAPLPGGASVGNSIAYIPMYQPAGAAQGYGWIAVVGSDNHLYETRYYRGTNLTQHLSAWADLGVLPAGFTLDATSDSLAGSHFVDGFGTPFQTIYARGVDTAGNGASWTTALTSPIPGNPNVPPPVTVSGWNNMGSPFPWVGQHSVIQYVRNGFTLDGVFGLAQTNTLCRIERVVQQNIFTWVCPL